MAGKYAVLDDENKGKGGRCRKMILDLQQPLSLQDIRRREEIPILPDKTGGSL